MCFLRIVVYRGLARAFRFLMGAAVLVGSGFWRRVVTVTLSFVWRREGGRRGSFCLRTRWCSWTRLSLVCSICCCFRRGSCMRRCSLCSWRWMGRCSRVRVLRRRRLSCTSSRRFCGFLCSFLTFSRFIWLWGGFCSLIRILRSIRSIFSIRFLTVSRFRIGRTCFFIWVLTVMIFLVLAGILVCRRF